MLSIELAGETLQLHHERAIYWPARKSLIVADTHFGKDGIFRQHGIPIPVGSVIHDLRRLTKLVAETGAERLLVLGDFIHGALDEQQPFLQDFNTWRRQHHKLVVQIILGNHDRRINMSDFCDIDWHDEYLDGPFLFVHEPCQRDEGYVLAGHTHPVMRLTAGRGDALRLPVFWFQDRQGTLPSFGSMTGGFNINPGQNDRLFVVGPDSVLSLRS